MENNILTLSELKKHIKRKLKKNEKFDFLSLTENRDLSSDVERLFSFPLYNGYDWVKGNKYLHNLIEEIRKGNII